MDSRLSLRGQDVRTRESYHGCPGAGDTTHLLRHALTRLDPSDGLFARSLSVQYGQDLIEQRQDRSERPRRELGLGARCRAAWRGGGSGGGTRLGGLGHAGDE